MVIRNNAGLEELISSHLFDIGCLGIESCSDCLKAYFSEETNLEKFTDGLRDLLKTINPPINIQLEWESIEDPGWEYEWRKHFEPLWIGKDLLILAPWHDQINPPSPGHMILMDPGPAFGTGRHATTRLCLSAIKKHGESLLTPWKLLDVGTGSGILAIYGAMLGAKHVFAIDVDEEALVWAKRNVELNQLQHKITLSNKDISLVEDRFEMVVANITFEEIVQILPSLKLKIGDNGILILSGILNRETDVMIEYLNQKGLGVIEITSEEEWICLCAKDMKHIEI